jgi:hypothetical protein
MSTFDAVDAHGDTQTLQAPNANGSAADAASRPVAWSTEGKAQIGALTETAPASDTGSSGLNGRLQRIAQRITALIALLPASLGGKAAAASLSTTLATDDPRLALLGAVDEAAPASDTASSGLNGRLQRIAQRLSAVVSALSSALTVKPSGREYELAAASTTTVLGASGAAGDVLDCLLIIPATTSPGAVQIKDGAGAAVTVFTGGADSVSNLVPFPVPLGLAATGAGWSVIAGADVSALAAGDFS